MVKPKIKMLFKFKNLLIKKGKKAKADSLVLKTFFLIKRKLKKNPINIVASVLKSLTPGVTTKKTVVAGRLYHLPSPITKNKALYFSCNWLQKAAMENKELKQKSLDFKLADECFKVLKKKSQSLLMLKQHNKTVSENRPFLRFVRRKRKPRLPHKVWMRKKKLLWLSRRKKIRTKGKKIVNYSLKVTKPLKRIINLRKHMGKTKSKITKMLRVYDNRYKNRIIKAAKIRIAKDKLENPEKYIKLDLARQKTIANIMKPKQMTKYEQRSTYYKDKQKKYYNQNKTTNKKNKFQRWA
jgi:small subunit ribosomal protein S7